MGDGPPDLFDQLPEDVAQMIFSAICDCKTLVRCMAVSQAFYHHAVCVSSLSIVCPDNCSTYEEKLNKIYSMVKEFRELQTLVVRVGRPRDEPASWTRCMRYAEIGASVEKFMFMAAKSGDFSELDNALASSEYSYDFENSISQGSVVEDATESKCKDQAERASLSGKSNSNTSDRWRHTQNRLDTEFQNSTSYSGLMWSFFLQSLLRLRGFPRIGRLCDFSLRQVIAPSTDVMRRMLPVIHFAILQGLNEFRDVIPSFIANFPKLKRFLLVDISESVTIHLRQHNMEEIRSLHLQDIAEWEAKKFVVEHTVAENCSSQEMHAFGRSTETEGEIVEVQSAEMKIPEDGFISSVNNPEQPRSVQEEGVSKPTGHSMASNGFNHDANSTGLHSVGTRKLSKELDLQENLSSKIKLEKLRKGKELLKDLPEITEKEDCRKEFGYMKSDSKNFADKMGIVEPSCGIYQEKDGISWIKLEDANSTYSHEDSERQFPMHLGKSNEITCSKTASPSCQYGVSHHVAEEPPCNSPPDILDNAYAPISSPSVNGFIKFSKSSLNAECLHRPLVKSMENSCSDNEMQNSGRWLSNCSCSIIEGNLFASEAGSCNSSFEHTEKCNSQGGNIQEEITANGCKNSLQCEERENIQELYRCRSSRFQDIYHDEKMEFAYRQPFKVESENERLSFRDTSRSHKIDIFRTVDDFAGNLGSMRKTDESLGESEDTHTRKRQQFQTEDDLHLSPQMSISSSDQSLINHPFNSGESQKQHHHIFPECIWDQRPMDSSFQVNSLAKARDKTGSDKSFSEKDIVRNSNFGRSSHGRHLNSEDSLLKERKCLEGNIKESSSISSKRAMYPLRANQDTSTADRLIERQVWRGMKRERVRRLRDARQNSRMLEDVRRDSDAHRIVRNAFQRRKNDLEKEALSFDYSFWRAEQVVAENYHLSDLSMCIATYSPKPLELADIEILSYAALAGPLIAATVSHVNKQHNSHKL